MSIGLSPPQGLRASGVSSAAFPLLAPDGSAAAPSYSWSSDADTGFFRAGSGRVRMSANNGVQMEIGSDAFRIFENPTDAQPKLSLQWITGNESQIAFGPGGASVLDTKLVRDAANTFSQRNGSNAQISRIYNRTVSGADEWFEAGWASNVCTIKNVASGASGTLRGLNLGNASTALIGHWGNTPVAQPSGWTIANDLTDRSINFASFTLDELGDVVATLIRDLSAPGFVGAIS